VRDSTLPCRPRTQSSIAVSGDYKHWFLFNASPDIRSQIEAFPPLWPRGKLRCTPIQGIVLSDAELDHTLGLFCLREARHIRIFATEWVYTALSEWNTILRTLSAYCRLDWQPVQLGQIMPLCGEDGMDSGLRCQAFSTISTKRVAFASDLTTPPEAATVGYRVTDKRTDHALVYVPAVQALNAAVLTQLEGCTVLLFDGTCWD
jgi:pyrroloquinoline quinone biosynthesis protein B